MLTTRRDDDGDGYADCPVARRRMSSAGEMASTRTFSISLQSGHPGHVGIGISQTHEIAARADAVGDGAVSFALHPPVATDNSVLFHSPRAPSAFRW